MFLGLLEVDLHLPGCQSLKDKRSVLKKTIHRLRSHYNVSVAEVEHQDKWARAQIAIVSVSSLRDHIEEIFRLVHRDLETAQDIQVLDSQIQWL